MKYLIKVKDREVIKDLKKSGVKVKEHKHIKVVEVDRLIEHPGIISVEEDGRVHTLDEYDVAWGVEFIGTRVVHNDGIKGQGVKVAVIDTGVDYNHPELSGIYRGGYNFVHDNSNPMDDNNHGTHCAGIVSAALNAEGVVGVAPEIELYAVKVLSSSGSGYWSDIISGLDWCIENGMQITSNSYGGDSSSSSLEEAFQACWDAGIVSVAAAGNSGGGEDINTIGFPARYGTVLAVGAIQNNGKRAWFSSTGPTLEVSAPGMDVYSTLLNNRYGLMSGTSMACPHVAGLAALVKSAHPDWDNTTIRGQIRAAPCKEHDWLYGFGVVDAPVSCGELIPDPPELPEEPPPPQEHKMVTYPPHGITSHSVTFEGELADMGDMSRVYVYFAYRTPEPGPSTTTPKKRVSKPVKFSRTIHNLKSSTDYLCIAAGRSDSGKYSYGEWIEFRTAAK